MICTLPLFNDFDEFFVTLVPGVLLHNPVSCYIRVEMSHEIYMRL